MERTGKRVSPPHDGDIYVVKEARRLGFDRTFVSPVFSEWNDRLTWLRSLIIKSEWYHVSIRFIKICPRITKIITVSDARAEPTGNVRKRYDYRSFDVQLLIVFNLMDFLYELKWCLKNIWLFSLYFWKGITNPSLFGRCESNRSVNFLTRDLVVEWTRSRILSDQV
jgi:hypothetical protein